MAFAWRIERRTRVIGKRKNGLEIRIPYGPELYYISKGGRMVRAGEDEFLGHVRGIGYNVQILNGIAIWGDPMIFPGSLAEELGPVYRHE